MWPRMPLFHTGWQEIGLKDDFYVLFLQIEPLSTSFEEHPINN